MLWLWWFVVAAGGGEPGPEEKERLRKAPAGEGGRMEDGLNEVLLLEVK